MPFLGGRQGGGRDRPRAGNSPCPNGNGTTIGSFQQFTVLCASTVGGDLINTTTAADLTACADLCSSFHPRCDGISFDGSTCRLKANTVGDNTRPFKFADGAVASFQTASSNCASLGGTGTVGGATFGTFCNFIINGNDIAQNFAPTFQDCMSQCASTTGCGAVSFDASQSQGFKNCYLKGASQPSGNIADSGIDTAIMQNNAAVVASSAPAAAPATTVTAAPAPVAPATTTVQAPPATTSILVPTTVSAQPVTVSAAPVTVSVSAAPAPATTILLTASSSAAPPLPATSNDGFSTPSVGSLTAPLSSASTSFLLSSSSLSTAPLTRTQTSSSVGFPFPTLSATPISVTIGSGGTFSTGSPDAQGDTTSSSGSSRAWIAAPVVGSVASLVLIVWMFVMLGKKRNRGAGGRDGDLDGGSPSSSSFRFRRGKSAIGRPAAANSMAMFSTWLPGSPGRKTKMGNFSEVTGSNGKLPERASSVLGFWRPEASGMQKLEDIEEGGTVIDEKRRISLGENRGDTKTPVYELKQGKMELRNSMNGLSQNKW